MWPNNKKGVDAELFLKSLDGDIPIVRAQQEQNKESNKFLGNSISQVEICNDENINSNAKSVDEVKETFELFDTSPQFAFFRNQFKKHKKARRNITKTVVQFDLVWFTVINVVNTCKTCQPCLLFPHLLGTLIVNYDQ